jgi:hypothetical protein
MESMSGPVGAVGSSILKFNLSEGNSDLDWGSEFYQKFSPEKSYVFNFNDLSLVFEYHNGKIFGWFPEGLYLNIGGIPIGNSGYYVFSDKNIKLSMFSFINEFLDELFYKNKGYCQDEYEEDPVEDENDTNEVDDALNPFGMVTILGPIVGKDFE